MNGSSVGRQRGVEYCYLLCCGMTLPSVTLTGLISNRLVCSDLAGRGPFGQTSRMGFVLRNQTLSIELSKSNSVPYIDSDGVSHETPSESISRKRKKAAGW